MSVSHCVYTDYILVTAHVNIYCALSLAVAAVELLVPGSGRTGFCAVDLPSESCLVKERLEWY